MRSLGLSGLLALTLAAGATAAESPRMPGDVDRITVGDERGEVATSVVELDDGGFLLAGYAYDEPDGDWDALVMRVSATGRQVWSRSSDRQGSDYAWVVRPASGGRFVVAGTRRSSKGDTDGYLQCIDVDGREIWSRDFGGPGNEIFWAADRSPEGGFVLAGQTDSRGAGGLDYYVVRTDSAGAEIWSRTFGGPETDRALGVAVCADGGALVAGFQGAYPDSMDILLVRVDSKGNEQWRRSLPGRGFDVAHHVLRLADGGFLVTGYSASFGPGDQDGLLIRLTDEGRVLWMKTYGDASDDRVLHAASMPDGGYALVGYSRRAGEEDWDMVVRRVDDDGDLLWIHREGGPFPDMGKDVVAARDGTVVVVGGTRSARPPLDDIIILRVRDPATD